MRREEAKGQGSFTDYLAANNEFPMIQERGVLMEEYFDITGTNLTIFVPRELDHHNAEIIKEGADKLLRTHNIRRIIFDFGKTSFMDSSGIGMIMGRYKNIRFTGGTAIAIRVNERISRILTLSGVYKVIDIYEGLPQQSPGYKGGAI